MGNIFSCQSNSHDDLAEYVEAETDKDGRSTDAERRETKTALNNSRREDKTQRDDIEKEDEDVGQTEIFELSVVKLAYAMA